MSSGGLYILLYERQNQMDFISMVKIPQISFYFVRHGETDWNKTRGDLCDQDHIPLNEQGLLQVRNASEQIQKLEITCIYSSPLLRAKQTAEIINQRLNIPLTFHTGLREIVDEKIIATLSEVLNPGHTTLIVSHGEVYRILLRVLNIETHETKPKNGGLYLFEPIDDQWRVMFFEGNSR